MRHLFHPICIAIAVLAGGCASSPDLQSGRLILLIPGAGGDGPWYDGVRGGLRDAGIDAPVQTVSWGAPMPLYMLNLQTPSIHHAAEAKLAHVIEEFRKLHPDGQLSILAHSAGCGVALGALKDLPPDVRVNQMVLLAPSVSPEYHLVPSIAHLSAPLQVFYSGRDRLWLDWRTSTFGTYDNIKTKAAGNIGFNPIPDPLRPRLIQHSYDSAWSTLGNDGDHYGPLAKPFVRQILAPLLQPPRQRIFSPNPPPARS